MSTPTLPILKLKSERIQSPLAWEINPDLSLARRSFSFDRQGAALDFIAMASELTHDGGYNAGFLLKGDTTVEVSVRPASGSALAPHDHTALVAFERLLSGEEER